MIPGYTTIIQELFIVFNDNTFSIEEFLYNNKMLSLASVMQDPFYRIRRSDVGMLDMDDRDELLEFITRCENNKAFIREYYDLDEHCEVCAFKHC